MPSARKVDVKVCDLTWTVEGRYTPGCKATRTEPADPSEFDIEHVWLGTINMDKFLQHDAVEGLWGLLMEAAIRTIEEGD